MKLPKLIIVPLFTNLFFSLQAQNQYPQFYSLVRTAKKLDLQNKPDSSLLFYTNAFSKVTYVPEVYLTQAIKLSKKLKQKELYKTLSDKLTTQRNKIDKEYVKEITTLGKSDQAVRTNKNMAARDKYYNCLKEKNCSDKELKELKITVSKWRTIDSTDIYQLLALIKTKDYPSEKLVGTDACESAFAILLHFDADTNNHILKPILEEALHKGEIPPRDYAFIIDRREIFAGRPSYYYCVPFGIEKLSKDELTEVEKRRELINYGKISETQVIIKTKNSYQVKIIE